MDRRTLLWRMLAPTLAAAGGARAQTTDSARVLILGSERGDAYDAAAQAVRHELQRDGTPPLQVNVLYASEFGASAPLDYQIIVTLGVEAARAILRRQTTAAVLCALLPQASFQRVLDEFGRKAAPRLSALYLNQPIGRQLELVRLALPAARTVGVLWGPESMAQRPLLAEVAKARGLRLAQAEVQEGEHVFRELKPVVDEADLLLALADAHIYNSRTIQNILLTSFRARVPMLAFSPAYVRAGALLALYSTPAQIGQQAGVMAREALTTGAFGEPRHPEQFMVGVNEHVARSLGLQLDAQELTRQLRRREWRS